MIKIKKSAALFLLLTFATSMCFSACSKEEPAPTVETIPLGGGYYKEETQPPVVETEPPVSTEPIVHIEPTVPVEIPEPTEPILSYVEKARLEHEGENKDLYFQYQLLSDTQKTLYLQLCEAIDNGSPEFTLDESMDITVEDTKATTKAIWYDHPEFFWYAGKYTIYFHGEKVVSINLEYNDLVNKLDSNKKKFNQAVNTLVTRAADMSILDKERMFHDYICKSTIYKENKYDQTAWSCLMTRETVCAGYSRAFQVLMMKSGNPCYTVTGDMITDGTEERHAWNVIKLVDDYYALDITSDDCDAKECVLYNAYNFAYSDMPGKYIIDDDSVDYPDCTATRYSFENLFDMDRNLASALSYTDSETIIRSMDEFASFHESTIRNNGFGEFSFRYVVVGEELMEQITNYIQTGDYINTYIAEVAEYNGYETCTIQENTTKTIFEDIYGVHHTVILQ